MEFIWIKSVWTSEASRSSSLLQPASLWENHNQPFQKYSCHSHTHIAYSLLEILAFLVINHHTDHLGTIYQQSRVSFSVFFNLEVFVWHGFGSALSCLAGFLKYFLQWSNSISGIFNSSCRSANFQKFKKALFSHVLMLSCSYFSGAILDHGPFPKLQSMTTSTYHLKIRILKSQLLFSEWVSLRTPRPRGADG